MRSVLFGSSWAGLLSRFGMLPLVLLLGGCGPSQGKVSGRVLFNGAPLPGGTVTFVPAGAQNSVSATLDEQGNYEAVLPAGEVKVAVDNKQLQPHEPPFRGMPPGIPGGIAQKIAEAKRNNPSPPPAAGGTSPNAPQKMPGKYVEIPRKYYDISTSNLKFTVQGGDQTYNIELTK